MSVNKNHRSLFVTLFLLCLVRAEAQFHYDPDKVPKKAGGLYSKALELAQNDDFKGGIAILKQAVQVYPQFEDAYLSIAGMYGELKSYQSAIKHYANAKFIYSANFMD